MFARLDRHHSSALDATMHLWRFGDYGQPLLVFPSSAGLAHEWEHNGLIDVLSPLIEGGKFKLYCTESNVTEAWCSDADPAWRIQRHLAFERYVMDQLVPFIREDCRSEEIKIWLAGTSLGAFYSANFLLKHPDVFEYALCLSGRYDARWLTGGFDNLDVYYCNPVAFVPLLHGHQLEQARRGTHMDLVVGRGDWEGDNIEATKHFGEILAEKRLPHRVELWGHDSKHDWTWWNRQASYYLRRRLTGGDDTSTARHDGSASSF